MHLLIDWKYFMAKLITGVGRVTTINTVNCIFSCSS